MADKKGNDGSNMYFFGLSRRANFGCTYAKDRRKRKNMKILSPQVFSSQVSLSLSGFEAIFAIAALSAVVYLVGRKR